MESIYGASFCSVCREYYCCDEPSPCGLDPSAAAATQREPCYRKIVLPLSRIPAEFFKFISQAYIFRHRFSTNMNETDYIESSHLMKVCTSQIVGALFDSTFITFLLVIATSSDWSNLS